MVLYLVTQQFFVLDANSRTRGHNFKLRVPRCATNKRQNFFAVRVITAWNYLPYHIVNSSTVPIFKKGLNQINFDLFLSRSFDVSSDDFV